MTEENKFKDAHVVIVGHGRPNIDALIQAIAHMDHQRSEGLCPGCGRDMTDAVFRDRLSEREYTISGLCQECQDIAFAPPEE